MASKKKILISKPNFTEVKILLPDSHTMIFLCSFFGGQLLQKRSDTDLHKAAGINFRRIYKELTINEKSIVRESLEIVDTSQGRKLAKTILEMIDDFTEQNT